MKEYLISFTEEELEDIVFALQFMIEDRCIGNEGDRLEDMIKKIEKVVGRQL